VTRVNGRSKMKNRVWMPILLFAAQGFGQQIGVSLGSAVFDPSTSVNLENTAPPKNLCGEVAIRLSEEVRLNLAAGFGYENFHFATTDMDPAGNFDKTIRLTGAPLEIEIRISKPFVILSGIHPFIGLGLGYYRYSARTESRQTVGSTEVKTDINGPAQYFSFGLDYRLGRTVSAFCEMKKMGFSGIEVKGDYPTGEYPGGRFTQSLKSKPGLGDLSMTLGILFDLHPGRASSILEKF
jgi:hypothetical protein